MCDFDHPNVLPLIGVCIDGGPTPYIVTPFMSNGSLQSYLKKYRTELILDKGADESEVKFELVTSRKIVTITMSRRLPGVSCVLGLEGGYGVYICARNKLSFVCIYVYMETALSSIAHSM